MVKVPPGRERYNGSLNHNFKTIESECMIHEVIIDMFVKYKRNDALSLWQYTTVNIHRSRKTGETMCLKLLSLQIVFSHWPTKDVPNITNDSAANGTVSCFQV